MKFLSAMVLCGLAAAALTSPSLAASPEALVAEETERQLASDLPANAEISVRFLSVVPDQPLGVDGFAYDRRNGRFRVGLIDEQGVTVAAVGVAVVELEVPVPVRRIRSGEIIAEDDLALARLPLFQVGARTLEEADQAVGKQARRTLAAERPIQDSYLGEPIVGERGSKVTIVLRDGAIGVTAPGRLLENGAAGERVRVINEISSRTVEAHVVDPETVEIRP